MDDDSTTAGRFWEDLYASRAARPTGTPPNAVLDAVLTGGDPAPDVGSLLGDALDLGCAEGADAVWLAQRGWRVLGVDVSATALERTRVRAEEACVGDRVRTARHDLSVTFPDGQFDLVNAHYLQTPLDFPRVHVLRQAAAAVRSGGLLLIVDHASVAPWSWDRDEDDGVFPTPRETLTLLDLDLSGWTEHRVGRWERRAVGPGGQVATVTDNVMALRRH